MSVVLDRTRGMCKCEDAPCCGCGPDLPEDPPEGFDDDRDFDEDDDRDFDEDCDESMDGDHESSLASAGMGTDEDYGYYPEPEDDSCFYDGE